MTKRFTHVDLFAGVGGFTLGFESSGLFETLLMADSDQAAATTVKRNRPRQPFWVRDLRHIQPTDVFQLTGTQCGDVDVLTAGPPCQGFSRVGTRQLDDPRNELLKHTATLIEAIRPKIAIIENVPALAWERQSLFDELREDLLGGGYHMHARILDAWRYGVPQLRRRLFIVAVLDGLVPAEVAPFPLDEGEENGFTAQDLIRAADAGEPMCPPGLSVEEAIGDLPSIESGGGAEAAAYDEQPTSPYQRERRKHAELLFNHKARTHTQDMLRKMALIDEGGRNQELPDEHRLRAVDGEYYSQAYARLHRMGIAQTITTYFHNPGSGRFIHYRDLRSITVREAARFQGFDDDFIFYGKAEQQMRQVGNAVPPLLAAALAERCGTLLDGSAAVSNAA